MAGPVVGAVAAAAGKAAKVAGAATKALQVKRNYDQVRFGLNRLASGRPLHEQVFVVVTAALMLAAAIVALIVLGTIALLVVVIVVLLIPVVLIVVFIWWLFQPAVVEGTPYPEGSGIPAVYWPMHQAAAARAGKHPINPYLVASIHKQESDFSRNPIVVSQQPNRSGAWGPMQFLLSTWRGPNERAFNKIKDSRPGISYPMDRRRLSGCRNVPEEVGCVHDDFDAIAGAAHKLAADGADMNLRSAGTRRAVCAYIGDCGEVDNCTGTINQYCEVIPRAERWQEWGEGAVDLPRGPMPHSTGTLAWPLPPQYREISGGGEFGNDRGDHVHQGVDFPAPAGTPVSASQDGYVTHVCRNVQPCTGYGNFVCIEHSDRISTCYAHLSSFAAGLAVNRIVDRGDVIGAVGNTGHSFGNHLHFEVRLGRYPGAPATNPMPYLTGSPCGPVKCE